MHRKVLSQGELRLCHRERTKNPAETTGMNYKNLKTGDPDAETEEIGCIDHNRTVIDSHYIKRVC